jgi:zinc/manganese transport system substrate-binding protein
VQRVPQFVAGDEIDALDYAEGDAAGTIDPHFWTDPARMIVVVDALEQVLIDEVDGIESARVRENTAAYRAELSAMDEQMTEEFDALGAERRQLVTNHHVFGYLAQRFDFEIIGAIIPSGTTLAAPSASDLRDLTDAITDAGVNTIFADSSSPDLLVRVLADEVGLDVQIVELYTESLTADGEGADTYLDMLRVNTQRIVNGLADR